MRLKGLVFLVVSITLSCTEGRQSLNGLWVDDAYNFIYIEGEGGFCFFKDCLYSDDIEINHSEITIINSTYISSCRMSRNDGMTKFNFQRKDNGMMFLMAQDTCGRSYFNGREISFLKYKHSIILPLFDSLKVTRSVRYKDISESNVLSYNEIKKSYESVRFDSVTRPRDIFSIYDEIALLMTQDYHFYNGEVYDASDTKFELYLRDSIVYSKSAVALNCYFRNLYSLAFYNENSDQM